MIKLSAKHEQVITEYLLCWNATEAYQRVYDCTYDAARSGAARLLANASVAEEIERRVAENAMSANEVLARLAEHARGDIDDFLDSNGDFNLEKARQAKKTRLLKRLKTKTTTRMAGDTEIETTEVDFEMYDAQAALVQLGRHHKLFTDRTEETSNNTVHLIIDETLTDDEQRLVEEALQKAAAAKS